MCFKKINPTGNQCARRSECRLGGWTHWITGCHWNWSIVYYALVMNVQGQWLVWITDSIRSDKEGADKWLIYRPLPTLHPEWKNSLPSSPNPPSQHKYLPPPQAQHLVQIPPPSTNLPTQKNHPQHTTPFPLKFSILEQIPPPIPPS